MAEKKKRRQPVWPFNGEQKPTKWPQMGSCASGHPSADMTEGRLPDLGGKDTAHGR